MRLLVRSALGCLGLVLVYFALSFLYFAALQGNINSGVASWIVFAILVIACFLAVRFVHDRR